LWLCSIDELSGGDKFRLDPHRLPAYAVDHHQLTAGNHVEDPAFSALVGHGRAALREARLPRWNQGIQMLAITPSSGSPS
jgi:hypothetical protein